jgi:hypothetical protein
MHRYGRLALYSILLLSVNHVVVVVVVVVRLDVGNCDA